MATFTQSKVKELKFEGIEVKDWRRINNDWQAIKKDIVYVNHSIWEAINSLMRGIQEVERGARNPDEIFHLAKIEIVDYINKAMETAANEKKRLMQFREHNKLLETHATNLLAAIKNMPGRNAKTNKLHEFLGRDEQYALQVGLNTEKVIEALLVRLNRLYLGLGKVVAELRSGVANKVTTQLKMGIPLVISLAETELNQLYDESLQFTTRVDSFESQVIYKLRTGITDAIHATQNE